MKKDLFDECYDGRVPAAEFKQVFCDHCRNPTCALAQWETDKFGNRVRSQMDRLFNPHMADLNNPKYNRLRENDFPSLFREAIRLETADRVGDWSIPTENVVLANISPQTATNESQDLVEEAVRSLKGKDQGDQPKTEKPAQEASEPNVGDQQFTEAKTDRAESAQETIPNRSSNKENFETKPPKKEKPTETPPPKVGVNSQKNTDFPDGFVIGGELPSQDFDSEKSKKRRVLDSWGSTDSKVVEPGTKIKMGKKK